MSDETSWLQKLSDDIFRSVHVRIEPAILLQQIDEFAEECRDLILKEAYNFDRRKWLKGTKAPQNAGKDLVLSFLDHRFPSSKTRFCEEVKLSLEEAAKRSNSHVGKTLNKEKLRRGGLKEGRGYWFRNLTRIMEKYTGTYCLIRKSTGNKYYFEPFFLNAPREDEMVLPFVWKCYDRIRIGDLIANSERFTGTAICKSTDALIEPASIQFLRASRGDGRRDPPQLILSGIVSGWKDADHGKLVTSHLCLLKLNTSLQHDCAIEDIESHFESPEVESKIAQFEALFRSQKDGLLVKFIDNIEPTIGLHDARDAAGDLPPDLFEK